MKRIALLVLVSFFITHGTARAQSILDFVNEVGRTLNGGNNTGNKNSGLGAGLSNTEIVGGLKEALNIGAKAATSRLGTRDGFFGNQLVKILLPDEVRQVESTLRSFGFGSLCDKLILSMNRAAEDAAGKAVPIFVNAIRQMSIQDGLNILRGGGTSATDFLQRSTTIALTNAFRPVIQQSLGKVNATQYWNQAFTIYNKLPLGKKVNTDLTGYVTEKALNGLFKNIAQEEVKIRQNPLGTASSLIQKVFGGR